MEKHKEIIAVFDFDGTITTKDTLFDFIIFYKGRFKFIAGLFILSPLLILYKFGFIKNSQAKQKLFSYFFKGESIGLFDAKCRDYKSRIATMLNPVIEQKIEEHILQGHRLIIVSASIINWIEPWATSSGFSQVVATTIVEENGVITGRFLSENCYGQEKVNRLSDYLSDRDKYVIYAYGDSDGDKELLKFADYPTLLKD